MNKIAQQRENGRGLVVKKKIERKSQINKKQTK
jgi:hypothetical protein